MASYSRAGPSESSSTRYSRLSSPQASPSSNAFAVDPRMLTKQTASAPPEQQDFQEGSSARQRYIGDSDVRGSRDVEMGWNGQSASSSGTYSMDIDPHPIVFSTPYDGVNDTRQQPWPFPAPAPERNSYHQPSYHSHYTHSNAGSVATRPSFPAHARSSFSTLSQALSRNSPSSRGSSPSPGTPQSIGNGSSTSIPRYNDAYDPSHDNSQTRHGIAQPVPQRHRPSFSLMHSQSVINHIYGSPSRSPFSPPTSPGYHSGSSGVHTPDLQYPQASPKPTPTNGSWVYNPGFSDELLADEPPSAEEFNADNLEMAVQQVLDMINSQPELPDLSDILASTPPPTFSNPYYYPAHPSPLLYSPTYHPVPGEFLDYWASVAASSPPTPQPYEATSPTLSASGVTQSPITNPVPNNHYQQPSPAHMGNDHFPEAVPPAVDPYVDDELDKFIQIAANSERFDDNATIDEALKQLGLQTLQDKLPGMEVALMPHQVLGVAWMLDKEKGSVQGGCLADEMGLGKTVQTIATMVSNRSKDENYKSTLIVAPLALLDQWQREIEDKSNCGLKCFKYHGQGKLISKSELMKYDVVLTTFGTMSLEWPDYEKIANAKAKARRRGDNFVVDVDDEDMKNAEYRRQKRKQNAGLLFQVEWYRVVVDEAQNIRNRKTRMSRAIVDLPATYRWCLTGTPVVNTLTDTFGYLRFLRIRPWYDWKEFNDHIARLEKRRTNLAVKRLQAINATFLLRRKKDSKLDGKALVELPEKEIKLVRLEFTAEERQIYDMVERRSQARFNKFLKSGTVLKHYHRVLVLLLRLRQICAHPSLIQEDGKAFISEDEDDDESGPIFATELTRARQIVSAEFVDKLKMRLKREALDRIQAEKESQGNPDVTIDEDECPICYEPMTDAIFTQCAHAFCRECIKAFITQRGKEEATSITTCIEKPCPVCRGTITEEKLFLRSAFEPTEEELNLTGANDVDDDMDVDVSLPIDKGKAKAQELGRADELGPTCLPRGEGDTLQKLRDGSSVQTAIVLDSDDEELDQPGDKGIIFGRRKSEPSTSDPMFPSKFLPSSKMKYMMEQIQELARLKPNEKVLVVSQWTSCLSLVSDYLTEKNIPHVKYQGDMTPAKREQAVQVFMAKEKAMVMLMSLKCGGVGLNLTRANNVISLDLGWSPAVESQAFDRVHRVGQTKRVLVQRIVIAGTVEDRILEMQKRKQILADGSLGEGSGKKIGKLSVQELANLFGLDRQGRRLDLDD